jgi:acetyltransferase-like isoleucine patch superfamily enzyme
MQDKLIRFFDIFFFFVGSFRFWKSEKKPIMVNKGTWTGANIPKSSIIAANSYVGKCFYLTGIYSGSPAKFIKELVNE